MGEQDNLASKRRLDYLRRKYFRSLQSDQELWRRLLSAQDPVRVHVKVGKEPESLPITLAKRLGVPEGPTYEIEHNPFLNRIKLPNVKSYRPNQAIENKSLDALAHVFAVEHFIAQKTDFARDPKNFETKKKQFFDFLKVGRGNPYSIVRDQPAFGHELTFASTMPSRSGFDFSCAYRAAHWCDWSRPRPPRRDALIEIKSSQDSITTR